MHYLSTTTGWDHCGKEDIASLAAQMSVLTCDFQRVVEPATSAPAADRDYHIDPFTILPSSVEIHGLARNRAPAQAQPYTLPPMPPRQPGVYYTGTQYAEMSSQFPPTYSYSYADDSGPSQPVGEAQPFTPTDDWISQNMFSGIPDESPPYNLPADMSQMEDWCGVDLRPQLSAAASSPPQRRRRIRRNPDREARRRPPHCGTSSGHHHD